MRVGTVWSPVDLRAGGRNVPMFQSDYLQMSAASAQQQQQQADHHLFPSLLTFVVCLPGGAVVAAGGHPGRGVFCDQEPR